MAKKTSKKWTSERLAKFRATMAKKRAAAEQRASAVVAQKGWSSIPLDAIPADDGRGPRSPLMEAMADSAANGYPDRVRLAGEVVQLLLTILRG